MKYPHRISLTNIACIVVFAIVLAALLVECRAMAAWDLLAAHERAVFEVGSKGICIANQQLNR